MEAPQGPPALSTPDTHIFEAPSDVQPDRETLRLSDEDIHIRYEIKRTLAEIRNAKYARVALQFPDSMLPDAPRVFEALSKGLNPVPGASNHGGYRATDCRHSHQSLDEVDVVTDDIFPVRLYILADTSYGACCMDEIAAEHVNADAVVHYGRACLSPTARIPVIHVFTRQPIWNHDQLSQDFQDTYKDKDRKVILMADVTYQHHLEMFGALFRESAYCKDFYIANIVHDPSSPLPNRTIPEEVKADSAILKEWHLFHIADPPDSLLLTLASRVASVRIFLPLKTEHGISHEPFLASTSRALSRRYALLTSVATVSIFGILINTLSVKNYLYIVEHVKAQILAAGKKSYTFVVGKVNAAKVANFSEIGAWVVIGCWESSLIDSKDLWKPVLTPFELELALKGDHERVWTGEWSSDFRKILDESAQPTGKIQLNNDSDLYHEIDGSEGRDIDSGPDSAPPEFDLRTGRYISHSRPMQKAISSSTKIATGKNTATSSLIERAKGDLAIIGGDISPGAEHLKSKRTWKGLGSDFTIGYEAEGAVVEQGRSGIAKGYTHGRNNAKA